ncbi:hypothetical protein G6F50_014710 [Rhizopus delemar]|uniref:Uncharacterized protein n=1 Tax=Rhizopus delemar TaxID=936053 RepID=A0A9P7C6N9_9FUNG|nr:hypothetical protein G6F50_014710 [Rhizopus delemar]
MVPAGLTTRYRVRHADIPGALSTIEAVTHALNALEAPMNVDALLRPFEALIDGQIEGMGEDLSGQEYVRKKQKPRASFDFRGFQPCYQNQHAADSTYMRVVPRRGLEPPHLAAHGPEPCASTNSATWANDHIRLSSRCAAYCNRLQSFWEPSEGFSSPEFEDSALAGTFAAGTGAAGTASAFGTAGSSPAGAAGALAAGVDIRPRSWSAAGRVP